MGSKTWLVARHEFAVTDRAPRLPHLRRRGAGARTCSALIGIGVFDAVRGGDESGRAEEQVRLRVTRVGYVDLSRRGGRAALFTSFREQDGVVVRALRG